MQPTLKEIEAIYHAALGEELGQARDAYLSSACGENATLRARVEALLQAHDEAGDFLEMPVLGPDAIADEPALVEGPGTVVGRYKLLEKVGEGGMAVVYMAESATGGPIRRKVALKIIKLGMDTRQVIARFEAERQALALMDHPCIAKVHDAGATETGRPYFVMELVQGVSITEYCDRNSLSTKDRLGLFIQVCHAVQHAHQRGVIHRDIKPSNVMVTHHDGKPVPKIIDFGIAKAINQKLTEKTLFTRYAHIIGTPAYMSPEQAELSDLDVDTRTDIYSLGVLLYELLTGTTPFSEEELRKAGYVEMQRVIREQEPVKPSTRVARASRPCSPWRGHLALVLHVAGRMPARRKGGTPMLREVRGDLDWIVMKSLEKDRARRYETPNGLAEDIRRHLEHEPVAARGPSATYRLRKFLRRHQVQVGIIVVIAAAAVAVGSILSMWSRDRAQLAEAEGFKHRNILSQAREQYAKADRDAALETIKPILASKHLGPEAQLLQATILVDNRRSDEAAAILGNLLDAPPAIAGAAHSLLARVLWESASPNAEQLQEIEEHRKKAETLLPETAEAYFLRAMTSITVKEQLAALDKALQLDSGHYESRRLRAFTYYASRKYEKLNDDALVMTVLRSRDPLGYSLRAASWRELGRCPEAIADYDVALGLTRQDDPQYADLSAQRCETLLRMGDYERAIAEAQECFTLWPDRPAFQYHTFCALTALGEYDTATTLFREIIAHGHESRRQFRDWCMRYVFDTLEAGQSWYPPEQEPVGPAFLPMVEAEETYRSLSAKGVRRLATDGFSAGWSPDGKKLAFSMGVHGYSGVAIFDPATKETDLLIVPGKDPRWSPDGKYIAFVRDCQFLRVAEFLAAERKEQHRLMTEEEVWVMRSDGTEPRRLARGGWPSWSQDSTTVYYQSRVDNALCSISVVAEAAQPKRIMPCSNAYPSVSSDNRRVAYLEGSSLKIKDLTSQTLVAEWRVPFATWGGAAWSPTGRELCLAGRNDSEDRTGLWVYSLDANEPARTLDGQIAVGSWASDGTKLIFSLGPPYFEVWVANLNPDIPTVESLSPPQTPDEHFKDMVAFYTGRIEADPNDAYAYSGRAHYYDCLHDRAKANADMRQWSAVLSSGLLQDSSSDAPRSSRRVISISSDCEIVFSAERPVNGIPMMSVAFGQKGRCQMKLFEIPMCVASLLGLSLLSGLDASPAHADFTFGEPVSLKSVIPVIDPAHDWIDCFSYDGLEMYIDSDRPGGYGGCDLYVLKRGSVDDEWGPMENLGSVLNTGKNDDLVSITADGLTLCFRSDRDDPSYDIYMATRPTRDASWGPAVNLGPMVNHPNAGENRPWISSDGLELYFVSYRSGGYGGGDIYATRRATTSDSWGRAVNLGPLVNSAYTEFAPHLSPDGLVLLFSDQWAVVASGTPPRPGGYGGCDMWMTRRASLSDSWQAPVNLGTQVNSPMHEVVPRLSPDGATLYFITNTDGTWGNWQIPIIPIVDFTGDGRVDGKDLVAMVVQLGGSDSLCDIGPYAWGDGVVDGKDLTVLAEYIGKEFEDPTLVAHWAFDEMEGSVASDSAGDYDGTRISGATWQPEGGMVGGALKCDGVTGCVVTDTIPDLGTGPFSVVAWVKGGTPGQIILSHNGTTDWLVANPIDGSLMTKLTSPTQPFAIGTSEAVITDGKWHRIALVWDGADRILYADGKEVARDALPDIAVSDAAFMIGASTKPGTLWSGLIDDVRIYSRIVRP